MPAVSVSVAGLAAAALVLGGVPASAAPASATASATAGSPVPARTAAAPPADCRAIPVEADGPHRSAEARESFGVDGTGVTIGIISSSFATAPGTATTLEQDIALGVLPGPGNPCGYETPVEVVFDVAPGTGTDEGRAMAQLIHGIAPGARLLFASSDTPPGQPADPRIVFAAVEALADAGADIIVDDILEPAFDLVFQKGLTSAQMDESSAANPELIFLSSAGNANALGPEGTPVAGRPIASWQTSAYRPAACPDWMTDGSPDDVDCLDFSPDAAGDTSFGIELHGSARPEHSIVQWADAAAVGSELPTVLEMRIYDAARTRVATTSLTTPLFRGRPRRRLRTARGPRAAAAHARALPDAGTDARPDADGCARRAPGHRRRARRTAAERAAARGARARGARTRGAQGQSDGASARVGGSATSCPQRTIHSGSSSSSGTTPTASMSSAIETVPPLRFRKRARMKPCA